MARWTINGRFYTQPTTGVQRYATEIVKAIDTQIANRTAHLPDLDLEILVPPGPSDIPKLNAIPVRRIGRTQGHLWEQMELPMSVRGGLLSLANTGPICKRNQIVCIHDANTRSQPQSYTPAFRAAYRLLHPLLGRTARHITTVSNYAAGELARHGIALPCKTSVIYNGADHAAHWPPVHSGRTARVASLKTIVLLGSRAAHKNLSMLTDIADDIGALGLCLAIVGLDDKNVFAGHDKGIDHPAVHSLGRISDSELAALLRDSLCLAFPSLAEGFGLPPLEAMIHGCPVVASNRTSIPEVCGDAALYANPSNPGEWLAHFRALSENPEYRRQMISRGYIQARKFTWSRAADLYLEAMRGHPKLGMSDEYQGSIRSISG